MVTVFARSPIEVAARCKPEPLIFDNVLPEICPALEQVILHRMKTSRVSLKTLNIGGWKSGEDFFSWPEEPVQLLREAICEAVAYPRPVAWAMVNRAGSHHPRHQHRAAIIAGVYFVTVGSEDAITPTIYECEESKNSRYDLEVEPHPGRLVVSRGETWHRLPPYHGDLPRITVAFDVRR